MMIILIVMINAMSIGMILMVVGIDMIEIVGSINEMMIVVIGTKIVEIEEMTKI
jgi:hypothetical protein